MTQAVKIKPMAAKWNLDLNMHAHIARPHEVQRFSDVEDCWERRVRVCVWRLTYPTYALLS